MSVLLVEDDRDIREAVGEVLESEGYRVLYANDGRQGLAEARRYHPDLILLDLMMPVMDGWQFRAEQKQERRTFRSCVRWCTNWPHCVTCKTPP